MDTTTKQTPAITLESRYSKLTNLALLQAEKQLMEGTASSQIVSILLDYDRKKKELLIQKLQLENKKLEAQIEAEKSKQKIEDAIQEVMDALKSYTVQP